MSWNKFAAMGNSTGIFEVGKGKSKPNKKQIKKMNSRMNKRLRKLLSKKDEVKENEVIVRRSSGEVKRLKVT